MNYATAEVSNMTKKRRTIIHKDNIIAFPGMPERLLQQAHEHAEHYEFKEAVANFEQAFTYIEGDDFSQMVYAYALNEMKVYEKAKDICESLLAKGTSLYLDVMELYITTSMQLKNFRQVETMIASLLEEKVIPPDKFERFEKLQTLNAQIADDLENTAMQPAAIQPDRLEDFFMQSLTQQIALLNELSETNVRPLKAQLQAIIEQPEVHPFVQSLALLLLKEQEVTATITVAKFTHNEVVNPAELLLPTELPQYRYIEAYTEKKLEKDPTALEMLHFLLAKHAIVTYPFEWTQFDVEDVALTYIHFVEAMFGKVQETDEEILAFLQMLEGITAIYDA